MTKIHTFRAAVLRDNKPLASQMLTVRVDFTEPKNWHGSFDLPVGTAKVELGERLDLHSEHGGPTLIDVSYLRPLEPGDKFQQVAFNGIGARPLVS
jgi:hypothetical protein